MIHRYIPCLTTIFHLVATCNLLIFVTYFTIVYIFLSLQYYSDHIYSISIIHCKGSQVLMVDAYAISIIHCKGSQVLMMDAYAISIIHCKGSQVLMVDAYAMFVTDDYCYVRDWWLLLCSWLMITAMFVTVGSNLLIADEFSLNIGQRPHL